MSKTLTFIPFNLKLKRKNYFLLMIIINIIITISTIILSIPSFLALFYFMKKKNCSHSYFKFYRIYLLVISVLADIIIFFMVIFFTIKILLVKSSEVADEIQKIFVIVVFSYLTAPLLNIYLCNVSNCMREIKVDYMKGPSGEIKIIEEETLEVLREFKLGEEDVLDTELAEIEK